MVDIISTWSERGNGGIGVGGGGRDLALGLEGTDSTVIYTGFVQSHNDVILWLFLVFSHAKI